TGGRLAGRQTAGGRTPRRPCRGAPRHHRMARPERFRTSVATPRMGRVWTSPAGISATHPRLRDRHPRARGGPAVRTGHTSGSPAGRRPMIRLQTPLAERYTNAPDDELAERIAAAKAALGDRLFILG